ncbi:hypothetical protein [Pseudomonas nunensis]|uniref:Uncharacterized protein n=1 Tax=Pseudomonas nunensis TaxID=2961896 RepID=A0ABY5ELH7_9PSED|nr:hypothetical protein [Pseudomonas nunensis]MCL5230631.1 hypothetical protein [Pseudomonas nunensis]UTO15645.1 hypothetical protein NK667_04575 [Pseudomonas nunensis]
MNNVAEVARSTALFFEADRLEALAYSILDAEAKTGEIWKKFKEAKAIADAKRVEATRIWIQATRQKKPTSPKLGTQSV